MSKKIPYKTSDNGFLCITECPYKQICKENNLEFTRKVGSIKCKDCDFFEKVDHDKDIVYCNYEYE